MRKRWCAAALAAVIQSSACAAGTPPAMTPETITLKSAGEWRCPPGQRCDASPDYIAYVGSSKQLEIFMAFAGSLQAPLSAEALQRNFRSLDLYLPDSRAGVWRVITVSAAKPDSGSVRFVRLSGNVLRVDISAPRYIERTEQRGDGVTCQIDDMKGRCIRERSVAQAIRTTLELPMKPFAVTR